MAEKSNDTLFGQSPTRLGRASLAAAGLAFASQALVVPAGVFLCIVALVPLMLMAVACGLLAVGSGVYYKDWTGSAAGALGLILTGWLLSSFLWNLTHF